MRNQVSPVFSGTAASLESGAADFAGLALNGVLAFDADNDTAISSSTSKIGIVKRFGPNDQGLMFVELDVDKITLAKSNSKTNYTAKSMSLTVSELPDASAIGQGIVFKVMLKQNLSIVPNQQKFILAPVQVTEANIATTTAFAAAIADAISLADNNKAFQYVSASSSGAKVTVTALPVATATPEGYNHIDRPEYLDFELNAPDTDLGSPTEYGAYTIAVESAQVLPIGAGPDVVYMEEMAQGRLGFTDRRSWNVKKYEASADLSKSYDILTINSEKVVEGDLQGLRSNPVGVTLALESAAVIITDIERADVKFV